MKPYHGITSIWVPVLIIIFLLTGCGGGGAPPGGTLLPSDRKAVILQMTTFCENDPYTTLQYNYAENNGDGAGITFGCIGFTTGTFSGNILIKYYTVLNPDNTLAKYIPALDRIDNQVRVTGTKSDDTTGLDNLISDVQNCTDPLFKEAQRHQLNQLFWDPAVQMAENIGAKYPITLAFLYDMCVNHGRDGAQRYVNQTSAAMGGTPLSGIDERQWLTRAISIRNTILGSDRSIAYQRVLNSGNVNLVTPFAFSVYGDTCTIDGNVGY